MSNVVYLANADYAVGPLMALKDSNYTVSLVVSQKDKVRGRGKSSPTPVKKYAQKNGLPVYCTDDINSEEAIQAIASAKPDFIVVVAFGQFIGSKLLQDYPGRILNVHASILPKYRGPSPIHYALLNRDKKTGVSIMLVNENMDEGDILKICSLDIEKDHFFQNLSDDLSILGGKCLIDTLDNYNELYEKREKQDNSQASYTKLIEKDMGHISFNESSDEIIGKFKAFSNWPKLYFSYKGQNVKIHDFKIADRIDGFDNGQIIKANERGIHINCKDKLIIINELQFPNKKRMSTKAYLLGNDIEKIKVE